MFNKKISIAKMEKEAIATLILIGIHWMIIREVHMRTMKVNRMKIVNWEII